MRLKSGVPVLARPDGAIQVGIHSPVILAGLEDDAAAFVAGLEGRPRAVGAEERSRFAEVLARIEEAELVAGPRDGQASLTAATVRVRGVTPATRAAAAVVVDAGVGAIGASAVRGAGHLSPAAAALHRELSDRRQGLRVAAAFARADAELVAGFGAIDVVAAQDLMAADVPHLPVVSDDVGVTVGPLVVPGVTPCSRCVGLSRAERDPAWPSVALQLAARPGVSPVAPEVAATAGALAGAVLSAHLAGATPTATAWRVEPGVPVPRVSELTGAAHPDCGCGAATA